MFGKEMKAGMIPHPDGASCGGPGRQHSIPLKEPDAADVTVPAPMKDVREAAPDLGPARLKQP